MHPALSVIFFTTLSGAGYGLWFLLALGVLAGAPQPASLRLTALLCGLALVSAGLLASLSHLGQPQRAWRALSQWRSSWLSREGVAALLTFLPALALLGAQLAALHRPDATPGAAATVAALLLALGCGVTVFCTARIYTSLKPIADWHNPWVLPVYLLLGLYSGALWLWALADLAGAALRVPASLANAALVALGAMAGAALKLAYWRDTDTRPTLATPEGATGLTALGRVRSLERPHSEANYLTREMGFVLARKHATVLRRAALLLAFALPLLLLDLALAWPTAQRSCALLALGGGSVGILVERWLFFAQARHTVMLYYGAERA